MSWLRIPNEPENSYKWFTYYRDMEGVRRLTKLVEVMKTKEPYLESYPSYNQIRKASSKWYWNQRVRDYDNYLQIQLIDSHKQTLISYEEESITIDKKLYTALNTEISKIIKNNEIDPIKKIKAYKEAQELNKALLGNIEHIANVELPETKYIDLEKTKEDDIINALIKNTNGIITDEELDDILDEFTDEEIRNILVRKRNELNHKHSKNGFNLDTLGLELDDTEEINYNGETFTIQY